MKLKQNLNLITQIFKQTVGLKQICRDDFNFYSNGNNNALVSDFWRYDNIALNQRFILPVIKKLNDGIMKRCISQDSV